jgi:hypothetical protein
MRNATLARTLFWLGMAGLAWLLASTIFIPLRVIT